VFQPSEFSGSCFRLGRLTSVERSRREIARCPRPIVPAPKALERCDAYARCDSPSESTKTPRKTVTVEVRRGTGYSPEMPRSSGREVPGRVAPGDCSPGGRVRRWRCRHPPPLRTTREWFHSCSSSLSNAPCGTRLPLPQGCRVRTAQPSLRGEPSRYRPGADTHHGRPHQQVVAAVICLPPEAVDQVFS